MSAANVTKFRVLPLNAANLCFSVHGIIEEANVALGQTIQAFDFQGIYADLGNTLPATPSTFKYNSSQAIYEAVAGARLMSLRSEPIRAVLDKAIGARLNAYLRNYQDTEARYNESLELYNSKSTIMENLTNALQKLNQQLDAAYSADQIGVLRTSTTTLCGPPAPSGSSAQTGGETQQLIPYRVPISESDAAFNQTLWGLQDNKFALWMMGQALPNLQKIWANEIAGMNLDIKSLQVAYLNTILMSPIAGVITRVRRTVGDYVKAGEPIIRVENNRNVLLVGTVNYAGIVSINSSAAITTTLPGEAVPMTIEGSVLAATSSLSDDGKWHVAVSCNNMKQVGPPGTQLTIPALPLNFSLDPNSTTCVFT